MSDWRPITPTGGDGENTAAGNVLMAKTFQAKPCQNCRSFEKQRAKLVEYLRRSRGFIVNPNGTFETPIAKDFPGRKGLVCRVDDFGWCRLEGRVVDDQATCGSWVPTTRLAAMLAR